LAQVSPSQARLLAEARVGHLATADAAGVPHVVPVCYALVEQVIYSVLDQKPKRVSVARLRRVRNIQANPHIALVVDHYEEDWLSLWYMLVLGRAELLWDGEERVTAIRQLRQKYPQYRDMEIERNPVIRITPTKVVSWAAEPPGSQPAAGGPLAPSGSRR
jgi:PPOX class probable F420-dependent enzyme